MDKICKRNPKYLLLEPDVILPQGIFFTAESIPAGGLKMSALLGTFYKIRHANHHR
jgi:hypothetical protein